VSEKMTSNEDSSEKVIDVRGLYCPEPVFRTKIEIERLTIGEKLKVLSDDPESEEDISRWVKRTGHELISISKKEKDLEFLIRKGK
jgi:tRNA 2-thiouridine synthesizing protein A